MNQPNKINTFEWLAEGATYKEIWREQALKIAEEERMRECTFRPQRVTAHSSVTLMSGVRSVQKDTNTASVVSTGQNST
jgi:hypothetical protein